LQTARSELRNTTENFNKSRRGRPRGKSGHPFEKGRAMSFTTWATIFADALDEIPPAVGAINFAGFCEVWLALSNTWAALFQ
jgi:hypothetical protein